MKEPKRERPRGKWVFGTPAGWGLLVAVAFIVTIAIVSIVHPEPASAFQVQRVCSEDAIIVWDGNAHTICVTADDVGLSPRTAYQYGQKHGTEAGWQAELHP